MTDDQTRGVTRLFLYDLHSEAIKVLDGIGEFRSSVNRGRTEDAWYCLDDINQRLFWFFRNIEAKKVFSAINNLPGDTYPKISAAGQTADNYLSLCFVLGESLVSHVSNECHADLYWDFRSEIRLVHDLQQVANGDTSFAPPNATALAKSWPHVIQAARTFPKFDGQRIRAAVQREIDRVQSRFSIDLIEGPGSSNSRSRDLRAIAKAWFGGLGRRRVPARNRLCDVRLATRLVGVL